MPTTAASTPRLRSLALCGPVLSLIGLLVAASFPAQAQETAPAPVPQTEIFAPQATTETPAGTPAASSPTAPPNSASPDSPVPAGTTAEPVPTNVPPTEDQPAVEEPNAVPTVFQDLLPSGERADIPHDLSPWGMFMAADWVVKGVMIGLAFASLVTWTVWLAKTLELTGA
ncbi:MAG: tonB-system energizer ExbB, partial [Pseudorhizobium sp.]